MELEILEEGLEWDLPWAYLIVLKIPLEHMTFITDMVASVVPTGSTLLSVVQMVRERSKLLGT